jgi:tRNA A-37 threonylcarbamoyl transferase component Bud32
MKTFIIKNWKWLIEDAKILECWFENFEEQMVSKNVKSSTERDVFTILISGQEYYVKYSHPKEMFQKIRSYFSPKLIKEYKTIKLLKSLGISTPNTVGVGSNGSCSMLITEAVTDAVDLRFFWFKQCHDTKIRKKLLDSYTNFLKSIINSGIYHPDFHPGNILIKENQNKFIFYLIDTYGIKQYKKKKFKKVYNMLCIIGSMRGELRDNEAITMISKILEIDQIRAKRYWSMILKSETIKTNKLWKKRKSKLLKTSKYTEYFKIENKIIRVRKQMTGALYINKKSILNKDYEKDSNLNKKTFNSFESACEEWLDSFKMQFHRIPNIFPLIWVQEKEKNYLFYIKDENVKNILSEKEIQERKSYLLKI